MNAIINISLPSVFVTAERHSTDTTAEKIRSFASRSIGWHYGSGGPASKGTVGRALTYLAFIRLVGFAETDAFPGIDGEVMITGYHRDYYIELTLELDGSFRFAYQKGDGDEVYLEGIQAQEAAAQIIKAGKSIEENECGISEWSTSIIMTTKKETSKIWLSGLREMRAGNRSYLFSRKTVQSRLTNLSVAISSDFTKKYLLTHQSIGPSTNQISDPTLPWPRSLRTTTNAITT